MQILHPRLARMHAQRVVSWHEHLYEDFTTNELDLRQAEDLIEAGDRLGIDVMAVSRPDPSPIVPPERFRMYNDAIYEATRRWPGRFVGFAFVDGGFSAEAVHEMRRAVEDLGFVGVKLYHQYRITSPVMRPIIETAIELDIPILLHSGKLTRAPEMQPFLSDGMYIAEAARRYPEATFHMGHIAGGGDWDWQIRAVAGVPNVYADLAGSVYDAGLVEKSVRLIGAANLLFATDMSLTQSVGRILSADISDADLTTILDNPRFARFLRKN